MKGYELNWQKNMKRINRIAATACVLLACVCGVFAQQSIVDDLKTHRPGEGEVTLVQDAALTNLLGKPVTSLASSDAENKTTLKVNGYRVQVYAGNNSRSARNEANAMADKVKELFPELVVYTHFVNPRWLCRVGDFCSIEEADAVMRKLKATGSFREVSIVRGQVNIHY